MVRLTVISSSDYVAAVEHRGTQMLNSYGGKFEQWRAWRLYIDNEKGTWYAVNAFTQTEDSALLESNMNAGRDFAEGAAPRGVAFS